MEALKTPTKQQQTAYCFPILKNSVILQCMTELGYDMTERELLEPHKYRDRIRAIFRELVKLLLGLSEEELGTPSKAFVDLQNTKPYPELHDESAIEIRFFRLVVKLMNICGITDFALKDLTAPNAKRLKRQLSGAINLCKFYEERANMYSELTGQRDELIEGLSEVEAEHVTLAKQKEESILASMDRSKEIQEIENECLEIEQEISKQNKLQASIRTETGKLKKQANSLKGKAATALLSLQEAKSEEHALSTQVVQSPKRIKREMEQAVKFLEATKKGCNEIEHEVATVKRRVQNVKECVENVQNSLDIMENELKGINNDHNLASKELQEAVEKKMENEKVVQDFLHKKRELERRIHYNEEKLSHHRQQGVRRLATVQQELDFAQTELALVEKERIDGLARVESAEADVLAIEAKIKEDDTAIQHEIEKMMQVYKKFENDIIEKEVTLMTAALAI